MALGFRSLFVCQMRWIRLRLTLGQGFLWKILVKAVSERRYTCKKFIFFFEVMLYLKQNEGFRHLMNGELSSASPKGFLMVVGRTYLLPVNVGSFRSLMTSPPFLFLCWDTTTKLMSQTNREVNHIHLNSCERQNLELSLITWPFSLLLFTLLPLQDACWCWAESVNGFLGTD